MVTEDNNQRLMLEKRTVNVIARDVYTNEVINQTKAQKNDLDVSIMSDAIGCYFIGGTDQITVIGK